MPRLRCVYARLIGVVEFSRFCNGGEAMKTTTRRQMLATMPAIVAAMTGGAAAAGALALPDFQEIPGRWLSPNALGCRAMVVPAERATRRRPRRTIEHVAVERVGPVSAEQLIGMPHYHWGLLRNKITDERQEGRNLAHCLKCGRPVFISVRRFGERRLPYFQHFQDGDTSCPWFSGQTLHPDKARAAQYQGQQESYAHRFLCNEIARLALLDARFTSAEVSQYLPPTENRSGRYPDVLPTRNDGWRIAIEIQLSNTFQTEISARCLHYDREGIPLLWVFYGVDLHGGDVLQSFRDVLLRHRYNAFFLDTDAVAESQRRQTLVLKCYVGDLNGNFDQGRLVTLDDLKSPPKGLPFFEDQITPALAAQLAQGEQARRRWEAALRTRPDDEDLDGPTFLEANDQLCILVPELAVWQAEDPFNRWLFANLIAVLLSTLSYAEGDFRNYASRQLNALSMLNSKLPSQNMLPFATIMGEFLTKTRASALLTTTVGEHLNRALAAGEGKFVLESEVPWFAVRALFPEVFDPWLRLQLEELGALPAWATPDVR
jgi:hypothetical protein